MLLRAHQLRRAFSSAGPGLSQTHAALSGEQRDAQDIPNDTPSLGLYATMLARSLAQIVNVLDPQVIVLGGGVSNLPGLATTAAQQLGRYGFSYEGRTRIVAADHGDASGVLGACWLWP